MNAQQNPDPSGNRGLQIWNFKGKQVGQILEPDGRVGWVGNDIAGRLGYVNPRDALRRHCKGVVKRDTLTRGGIQATSIIYESDVFRLIANSTLPEAVEFERWLFEEVLPSIRKTGSYSTSQQSNEDVTHILNLETALADMRGLFADQQRDINLLKQLAQVPLLDKPANYDTLAKYAEGFGIKLSRNEIGRESKKAGEKGKALGFRSIPHLPKLGGVVILLHHLEALKYWLTDYKRRTNKFGEDILPFTDTAG